MPNSNFVLEILKILIPALITILAIFIARHFERKRDAELKIREKKIQAYEEFVLKSMNFVLELPKASEKRKKELTDNFSTTVEKFSKYILFWGSGKVIRGFNKFFKENHSDKSPYDPMIKFEKFILLLRKDIGQSNNNLKKLDLIKLFVVSDDINQKGDINLTKNSL